MNKYIALCFAIVTFASAAVYSAEEKANREYLEMDPDFVERFAQEWVDDWNAHDLDRILSHYEDDFEMSSPAIKNIYGEPSGKLKGKDAIGEYWRLALERNPTLRFELLHVLVGSQSITLIYNGARGLSAETFVFSTSGKVSSAFAHYRQ